MGSFIAKQPNGLYCRFSTIVDCPKCGRVIKSLKYYKRVVITNFGDPESNKSMTISLGEYKLWEQNLNGATHEK